MPWTVSASDAHHCAAVPSDTAAWVADGLIKDGRIRRGYLGVAGQRVALPSRLLKENGLTKDTGMMIMGVEAGSPARTSGLRGSSAEIAVVTVAAYRHTGYTRQIRRTGEP